MALNKENKFSYIHGYKSYIANTFGLSQAWQKVLHLVFIVIDITVIRRVTLKEVLRI